MATYLICHGAWSAGWAWKKVRPLLVAAGHEVFTPSYTGLGERAHLISPQVGLETHIADILAVPSESRTPQQAAALTATQVNAMETVDLQTLAATQIAALSTSVISHLLTLQMQNLLDSQIASLTTTQVGVLTAA